MDLTNYGPFASVCTELHAEFDTRSLNAENYSETFLAIENVMKDYIESDVVHKGKIAVTFADNARVTLTVPDFLLNVIMWYMLVATDTPILGKHIFWDDCIRKGSISSYVNRHLLYTKRTTMSNLILNNIISDTLSRFRMVDQFSLYLANTVNIEDDIDLMNKCPEYYELLHADLSGYPLEDVKAEGMRLVSKAADIIKDSKKYLGYDHCLADAFRAGEGINLKQFRECAVHISTKPDTEGGVYPQAINHSFMNGGVADIVDNFIESSTGRQALILQKINVGDSGYFARLLRLNNIDTFLHHDHHYDCHTKNFEEITISSKKMLQKYDNRYYRMSKDGIDYKVNAETDEFLIGKTVFFRSPITCASRARGEGVCYKCYGDLAYVNSDIAIGVIAAEMLSSDLTQRLLSAKHLLETVITKMTWCDKFYEWFVIDGNTISINDADDNYKGFKLIIDNNNIQQEDDECHDDDDLSSGDGNYNDYITEFTVETPSGAFPISTKEFDKMIFTPEFRKIIRSKTANDEDQIVLDLEKLRERDIPLFVVVVQNNALTKTLNEITSIMNKVSTVQRYDRNSIVQALVETVIEADLDITAIHCEILLSNQIRKLDDITGTPDWSYPDEDYQILPLSKAIYNHPSITISLSYQSISRQLIDPLTYKKRAPSVMDLFFMDNPQRFLQSQPIVKSKTSSEAPINPMIFYYDEKKTEEVLVEDIIEE